MSHETKYRHSGEELALGRYCVLIFSLILFFADAQAQSGGWTKKKDVPTGRVGASACALDGKIYVMGGMGAGYADVATNEVYDPVTDTWQPKAPMPTVGSWPSSAVANGVIYRIGGGWYAPTRKVEAYDPVANIWTTRADMPTPRSGAQAALVNGIIYNIGGYPNLRNCEAYDPGTNTWTRKTDRPEAGGIFAVTTHNGMIYTFGGGSKDTLPSPTVYAYNPQTDTWTKKKDMLTARFGLQTYLIDGKIYAIGGSQAEGSALASVELYDPVNDTWTTKSNMPKAFTFFAGAVVNGKIYVIGGTMDWSTGGIEVWEYDPAFHTDVAAGTVTGSWTRASSPYHINGEISIPDGATLTIEPGVEVVFMGHYKFNVQGRLLAVGTQKDSIRLTAENTGTGWHGIRFINTPSINDTSKLLYCSFKYGKANTGGSTSLDRCGGAMMIYGFDKVLVSNCLFENNMTSGDVATTGGPGVCIFYGSPTITNSTFRNNTGTSAGALKIDFTSNAVISKNIIANNTGSFGAVLCAYQSDNRPTISGNIISNNIATAGGGGGGIFVYSNSNPRIENNIIIHNQAPIGGGIYCNVNASPVLVNNTIADNTATDHGGGLCCESNSDPILVNNIVYGNSATAGKQLYLEDNSSDPTVAYSNIEGGKGGIGGPGAGANYVGLYEHNIDNNPSFKDSASGDYRLLNSSPCIGAGTDSMEIAGGWYHVPPFCIYGMFRPTPAGSKPDMGACESLLGMPTGIDERSDGLPTCFALEQNYPNPFNPTTVVSYQLPVVSEVKLVVFDILGREVATLVNERKAPGTYTVQFDGSNLASGVYLYRLQAGSFVDVKKFVLVK